MLPERWLIRGVDAYGKTVDVILYRAPSLGVTIDADAALTRRGLRRHAAYRDHLWTNEAERDALRPRSRMTDGLWP